MIIKTGTQLKILKVAKTVEDIGIADKVADIAKESIVEAKDDRYVYFWTRAVTADVANANGDLFELETLKKSYKTFVGRNLFLDHNSASVKDAVGIVVDAYLMQDDESKDWAVYCLGKVDRHAEPVVAKKVESGTMHTVSMGASVGEAECGICGKVMHNEMDFCPHMQHLGKNDPHSGKRVTSINRDVTFTELSFVANPADVTAEVKQVFAEEQKKDVLMKAANVLKESKEGLDEILKEISAYNFVKIANYIRESDKTVEKKAEEPKEETKVEEVKVEPTVESVIPVVPVVEPVVEKIEETKEVKSNTNVEEQMELKAIFVKKEKIADCKWLVIDKKSGKIMARVQLEALFGKDLEKNAEYASTAMGKDLIEVISKEGLKKEAVVKAVQEKSAAYKPCYPSQSYMQTPSVSKHPKVKTKVPVETDMEVTAARKARFAAYVAKKAELAKAAKEGGDSEVAVGPTNPSNATPKTDQEESSHAKATNKVKVETDKVIVASVFDKSKEAVVIGDGLTASKDTATKEIVIKGKDGKEVKRLPDGFGDDMATVAKLISAIVATPKAEKPAPKPAAPKPAAPKTEEAPEMKKETASVKEASEQDSKVRAELAEMKIKEALRVKTEKCTAIVKKLAEKGLLKVDSDLVKRAMEEGKTLEVAKKAAFSTTVENQVKKLLSMDEISIQAFDESLDSVQEVKSAVEKKASLDTAIHLGETQPVGYLEASKGWNWD